MLWREVRLLWEVVGRMRAAAAVVVVVRSWFWGEVGRCWWVDLCGGKSERLIGGECDRGESGLLCDDGGGVLLGSLCDGERDLVGEDGGGEGGGQGESLLGIPPGKVLRL